MNVQLPDKFLDFIVKLQNYIIISSIGNKVTVYNKKLHKKTLLTLTYEKIEIINKLQLLRIPNCIVYIQSNIQMGNILSKSCNTVEYNYYETELTSGNINEYITNRNELTYKQFLEIFIELQYTLMIFRKVNLKHRNINLNSIHYIIDMKSRTYILNEDNNEKITITNIIHPIITDFSKSVFELYDQDNEDDFQDVNDLQELLLKLLEIVPVKAEQTELIQSIFDMYGNDDATVLYMLKILNHIVNIYRKYQ